MWFTTYDLEQLQLKHSDLESLTEREKTQKIRSQWIKLCLQAQDQEKVVDLTHSYHRIIRDYNDNSLLIHGYYEQKIFNVPHTLFNLVQRDQIKKSYEALLEEFSTLTSEEEKTDFAQRNADLLNLAQSLADNQSNFDVFFGQYLFLKQKKAWHSQFLYQWRIEMIQLFAKEGLDDFHYRKALATGKLSPILAKEKLRSPVKIIVAMINSSLLLMSTLINSILNLHIALRLVFFLTPVHPIVAFLFRLTQIRQILKLLANPINQVIRPLCLYTQWSHQNIVLLLFISGITLGYAVAYTSLMANLLLILPYVSLGIMAFNLHKISLVLYENPEDRFVFLFSTLLTSLFMGLMAYRPTSTLPSTTALPSSSLAQQWQVALCLHTIITILTLNPNSIDSAELHPLPNAEEEPACDDLIKIAKSSCKKAHLSHLFFNSPKDRLAINCLDIEANPSSVESVTASA